MYFFSKFAVGVSCGQYRCSHHPCNINFTSETEVSLTEDYNIPMYGIFLVPFSELVAKSQNEMFLVGELYCLVVSSRYVHLCVHVLLLINYFLFSRFDWIHCVLWESRR